MLENTHRRELYRIFARFFSYPDMALLEDLAGEVATVHTLLRQEPLPLPEEIVLDELEVAYTHLFISSRASLPAPPYGSVYLEENQQLMGLTSLRVLHAYASAGLHHAQGTEPPDFIATELEFLYYLVDQEIEAQAQQNPTLAGRFRQQQFAFYHHLLHPWVGQFCQRVIDSSRDLPLYPWSARMLLAFCHQEKILSDLPRQG
jgi:TorA maturation chaperone TorD